VRVDFSTRLIHKTTGKHSPAGIIPFSCLTCYLDIYLKEIDVVSAEVAVAQWKAGGRASLQSVNVLRKVIVEFGGGYRIWGKFEHYYKSNSVALNDQLKRVFDQTTVESALEEAMNIKGLGESYASKLLRFVSPNFVVLDSILREELCGAMVYTTFLGFCTEIASLVKMKPVEVEAALFTFVQLAKPNQRKLMWRKYQMPSQNGSGFSVCRCHQT
jgi:hypothetical protein